MRSTLILTLLAISVIACQEKERPVEIVEINAIKFPYKFSNEIKEKWEASEEPWRFQAAGSEYSYIGNHKKVSDNFYKDIPDRSPLDDSSFAVFSARYSAIRATDYIIERAKDEQIVIINEAHHKPKHRIFTKELLETFYAMGFRYFGAETMSKIDQQDLNVRKYPIYRSGTYTKEPQFGELVREALKIGYKVFPYEGEGNGKPREINQARNIESFLKENKDGKVLIHCGYQHAQEGKIKSSWEKAMAGRLLEYTGINPLTINQTSYDNKYEFKHLSPLQKRLELKEPTVFIDSNRLSFKGESDTSGFDIMVFHEQNQYENARPIWLLSEGKSWVEMNLSKVQKEYPYFLLAFHKEENYTEAVPVDLIEVNDSVQPVHLALQKGAYQIIIQGKDSLAKRFELNVE